jgi:hypothetical protein
MNTTAPGTYVREPVHTDSPNQNWITLQRNYGKNITRKSGTTKRGTGTSSWREGKYLEAVRYLEPSDQMSTIVPVLRINEKLVEQEAEKTELLSSTFSPSLPKIQPGEAQERHQLRQVAIHPWESTGGSYCRTYLEGGRRFRAPTCEPLWRSETAHADTH